MRFAIAPKGIFWSIQGEGHLQGFQQAFLRLSGCSTNCNGCDTDFSKAEFLELAEVVERLRGVMPEGGRDQWVWVTGGEPADLPQPKQAALVKALKGQGWSVCVATSGAKRFVPPVDWLSVSPHTHEAEGFLQRYGNEVKLVDGLGGLDVEKWVRRWHSATDFLYRYVQPLSIQAPLGYREDSASLQRCLAFLKRNPGYAISQQRHHQWGVQ